MSLKAAFAEPGTGSASRPSSSTLATGAHLWADRYDGTLEDIFDLQDRITASVIGAIQPSIRAAESRPSKRKRTDSLDAYDLVMRALPYVWHPWMPPPTRLATTAR